MIKDLFMKVKVLIVASLLFLSTGCSQKSGFFNEDTMEQSAVRHTKKGQLYNSMEIKATIVSTYLNASHPEFKEAKEEKFLVSAFIDEDSTNPKFSGINNPKYELTLNGVKPTSKKKLDFEDELINFTPIRNRWSTYYIVSFPIQKDGSLLMSFKNANYGETVLEYSK